MTYGSSCSDKLLGSSVSCKYLGLDAPGICMAPAAITSAAGMISNANIHTQADVHDIQCMDNFY